MKWCRAVVSRVVNVGTIANKYSEFCNERFFLKNIRTFSSNLHNFFQVVQLACEMQGVIS